MIDLHKAFDTVDHNNCLKKLPQYGTRDTADLWFLSYLARVKHSVSINVFNSDLNTIYYGVRQCFVLGLLQSLIYINDVHNVIKFSTLYHFAEDMLFKYTNIYKRY